MSTSIDQSIPEPPPTQTPRALLKLVLFVDSRTLSTPLVAQIEAEMGQLMGDFKAELEVINVVEHPYVAEHYKLVATPALVKVSPLPAQVLAGADLPTQLEVWWPRWQRQSALLAERTFPVQDAQAQQETTAMLQMSEEIFLLQQEQARLKEQLQFKDRILAILAHDLRSPITATSLAVETLQQHGPDLDHSMTKHLFEHARVQLQKMDGMITDILEAARGTAGELRIFAHKTNLEELFASVREDYLPRVEAKHLSFFVDIPSDLPSVHADSSRIRQVFANLLDNAIKYTPDSGKIWVRFLHRTTQKIQVSVTDTGPGIPPEATESIFTDSVRLARDQQKSGYGIGLSLCRRIIRAHYGQIWVESRLNEGSTFHFTLPVYRA